MASRHFMPTLGAKDVGPDAVDVIPIFPAMVPIRYSLGMDAERLVAAMKGKDRIALEAPPASRKSVDVPAALLRGGMGSLVVHCVPSRLLAVHLHDYVITQHKDIPLREVYDYAGYDTFPTEGLVFTSANILITYMAAWRAHGNAPDIVLYLDEVHESDCGMATLRHMQTCSPGVRIYIESTATRGLPPGSYAAPSLPGKVSEYKFTRVPIAKWDMYDKGKPWSLLQTSGDFLVFEDNDEEARIAVTKFRDAGVRAYRLNAKTEIEDFRRAMRAVNSPAPGEGICALVVDYCFRSGFTLPTVTRIIDMGQVENLQFLNGRPERAKRNAHAAEIHQARNRGGRVTGQMCDYWRGDAEVRNVVVNLEGIESDIACILYRMLGRIPIPALRDNPYFSGLVPKQIRHVIASPTALRCYKSDTKWEGGDNRPASPPPVSPIGAKFDSPPQSIFGDAGDGDGDSVFTIEESLDGEDITSEQFQEQRRSRAKAKSFFKAFEEMPRPRADDKDFDDVFAKLMGSRPEQNSRKMDLSRYYRYTNIEPMHEPIYYTSFDDVLTAIAGMRPDVFVRNAQGNALRDVCFYAMVAYNDAWSTIVAAKHVIQYIGRIENVREKVGIGALTEWASSMKTTYVRAQALQTEAARIIEANGRYHYVVADNNTARESSKAEIYLAGLSARIPSARSNDGVARVVDALPIDPSGAYSFAIQPRGWRSRLALAALGNKPGVIDVAMGLPAAGVGDGGVYTTANQLSAATVRR